MYITSPKITIYIVKINLIFKIFCAEIKTDCWILFMEPEIFDSKNGNLSGIK